MPQLSTREILAGLIREIVERRGTISFTAHRVKPEMEIELRLPIPEHADDHETAERLIVALDFIPETERYYDIVTRNLTFMLQRANNARDFYTAHGRAPNTETEGEEWVAKRAAEQKAIDERELVGTLEISKMAGVTVSCVSQWKTRYESFPKPVADVAAGPVYSKREVEEWLKTYRPKK